MCARAHTRHAAYYASKYSGLARRLAPKNEMPTRKRNASETMPAFDSVPTLATGIEKASAKVKLPIPAAAKTMRSQVRTTLP